MHIDTNNLVGTVVSEVLENHGAISFVLNDVDSTPSREFKTTKYLQTEELTSIGVAVKDYGTIIVPKEVIDNTAIDKTVYAIIVKWGNAKYAIALNAFLALEEGDAVTFAPYVEGTYKGQIIGGTFPPFNATQKGKVAVVKTDGTGLEWANNDNELPSVTGNADKVLTVNDAGNGIEWKDVPKELPDYSVSGTAYKYLYCNQNRELMWQRAYPTFTVATDYGKALTVKQGGTEQDGYFEWKRILPLLAGNAGKVLAVNAGATDTEWVTPPSGGSGKKMAILNTSQGSSDDKVSIWAFTIYTPDTPTQTLAEFLTAHNYTHSNYNVYSFMTFGFAIRVADNNGHAECYSDNVSNVSVDSGNIVVDAYLGNSYTLNIYELFDIAL